MSFDHLSRRTLLQGASAAAAIAGFGLPAAAQGKVTIGILYVGPKDDFGWNQAHAVSVASLKATAGATIVEEENVPETAAVAKSMESMINLEGANLILATSFGYFNPFMVDMAKKYPKVNFRHASPLWDKDKHPANAGGYFGYLDQAHYVNGVAAGLASKSGKIGFVAAKPISTVLRNINSVLWGARTTNPNASLQVIFTGDWALPVREAEAANALIAAGCDVLTCHVDSPKVVIETAERRGIKSLGHNASQAPLAPKGFITGAEYKWETIYKIFADAIAKGQVVPNVAFGGYDKDMVRNTAYGAGADEAVRKAADQAIADLKANKPILKGPVKDNKGALVLPNASGYDNFDRVLDGMNFLAEGVVGSIT